jgi:membrane-bound serine protease (ClpP class)
MIMGSLMLIDSPDPAARISLSVILGVVGTTVAFFAFALTLAMRARLSKPTTGVEGLIDQIATAKETFETEGMVYVAGEYWRARSSAPVVSGAKVRVVAKEGMILVVEPVTPARESNVL